MLWASKSELWFLDFIEVLSNLFWSKYTFLPYFLFILAKSIVRLILSNFFFYNDFFLLFIFFSAYISGFSSIILLGNFLLIEGNLISRLLHVKGDNNLILLTLLESSASLLTY